MDYPIVITPISKEDGGGYLSYAPDLRGCMSDGETQDEALANLRDAMAEWLALFVDSNPGLAVPAPGSAAAAVQEERRLLTERLRDAVAAHSQLDDKLNELARDINDIRERIESIESWTRFGKLAGEGADVPTGGLFAPARSAH